VTRRDGVDLLLLAALWGASFLFMRVAVPSFGPVPLTALRCAIGAAVLLPLLLWRPGGWSALQQHAGPLVVVGLLNSALPFVLFGIALLTLTAGFSSLLNATAPLWGALVAYAWLGEVPSRRQRLGLTVGFVGVLVLVQGRGAIAIGADWAAIAAALVATLAYGIAAGYTRRRLTGVEPLAIATGSQLAATAALAIPAALAWPAEPPDAAAWAAAAALGAACTGLAYLLYFRLIERAGPARAMTVTFLVPLFGVGWGVLLLGEAVTATMLAGGLVILLGTALAVGGVRPPAAPRATP